MKNNIFVELLSSLNIKYTHEYAAKVYQENPYKNNLLGLSNLLSLYKIDNIAIKLDNKEDIKDIEAPYIAYAGSDFVLVKHIDKNKVTYWWNNIHVTIPFNDFLEIWSGILLDLDVNEKSIEPDYIEHRKTELLNKFIKIILLVCSIFFFFSLKTSILDEITSILYLIGTYISFLLLQKQLNIQNRITTKICSLLKEGDCNHTLESKFSHIWIFSWAEIGFAYFASSSIICLLHSECIPILSGYIIAALPYTIWSIWTQRVRTKQWCPLCLIVMSIFWILFFLFLYTNRLEISWHHTSEYIYIGLIYCCSILLINRSISFISNVSKNEEEIHQLRAIKYNGDIFNTLLNKSDWYDITLSTSCILFGKRNSKLLITILTNPYCEPCAEMHYRLKKIMQHDENRYCIQYIISNYNNPSSNSGKMLISAYLNRGEKYASLLFDNWFKYGKYHDEDFFKNENITIEDKANEEYSKHTNWIEQNNIMATPTLFINGYKLPNEYKIEDLNHILFNDDE